MKLFIYVGRVRSIHGGVRVAFVERRKEGPLPLMVLLFTLIILILTKFALDELDPVLLHLFLDR